MQTLKDSELRYHRLFETFQNENLLTDSGTGMITDVDLSGLLTFSKLNEIPFQDLATPSAAQQVTSVDRLFLFDFDLNLTEKQEQEEVTLAGIDQLPGITDDLVQRILNRENVGVG